MGKSTWFALLLTSTTLLTGCSLIGYGLASASDEGKPGTAIAFPEGLTNLPPNTKLIVLMKFDSLTQGRFKGVSPAPDSIPYPNYPDEYERWRSRVGSRFCHMPPFGAGVQIVDKVIGPNDVTVGRFAGLDPGCIRLITGRQGEIRRFEIESLKEMHDSLKHVITREDVQCALYSGVPFACGRMHYGNANLLLEDHAEIPLANIRGAYLWKHTDARWDAFYVGLGIDVTVVVVGGIIAAITVPPHF